MAVLALTSACSGASQTDPNNEARFRAITHAVFADGRLWLLHDNGDLASSAPSETRFHKADAGGRVLGVCKSQDRLLVLVDQDGVWRLKQAVEKRWKNIASAPATGDPLVAMDCDPAKTEAVLITSKRIVEMTQDQVHVADLSETIEAPYVTATALATDDVVWLGLNSGEWGGGLKRISRADGMVDTIQSNVSGELCGGPLNTECDPVNGLVVSPTKPSCVLAAVGLVHMRAHGRLVEVCENQVRRAYFKPLDPQPPRNEPDNGEPASTVPFFGLGRSPDGLVAVGMDGIYRFDESYAPRVLPLPDFENRGGYGVSFDVPGVALVLTQVNARASLSGSVPLMAIR